MKVLTDGGFEIINYILIKNKLILHNYLIIRKKFMNIKLEKTSIYAKKKFYV